ncbi:MAG: hypothetical protein WCG27_07540 [Pseudomonadota bacterium]
MKLLSTTAALLFAMAPLAFAGDTGNEMSAKTTIGGEATKEYTYVVVAENPSNTEQKAAWKITSTISKEDFSKMQGVTDDSEKFVAKVINEKDQSLKKEKLTSAELTSFLAQKDKVQANPMEGEKSTAAWYAFGWTACFSYNYCPAPYYPVVYYPPYYGYNVYVYGGGYHHGGGHPGNGGGNGGGGAHPAPRR